MKKSPFRYLCCFSFIILASCTLYTDPKIPTLHSPAQFNADSPTKLSFKNINPEWWKNYNDPELNQFVNTAVKNNYSYQIALKNIDIAETYVTQNMSSLFPQVNLGFDSERIKSSPSAGFQSSSTGVSTSSSGAPTGTSSIFNLQQFSGTVVYQLDLWNQIRNSIKQAEATEKVSEADARGVKLTVISSVVNLYFQLKSLNSTIENQQQQLAASEAIATLDNTQYKAGLVDYSVVDNAKSQVDTIKLNLISLQKQKQLTEYALAYVLGEYPENFMATMEKMNKGFVGFRQFNLIPSGISSQVICGRPDVQDAFNQILSYGYLQKESIANFLPNVSLTGNYGYASPSLGGLLQRKNMFWNLGLFSTQWVFDYENRLSQYHRADDQFQSSILNDKNVILNAYKDIDTSLTNYREDNESLRSYEDQSSVNTDRMKLAHAQYAAGMTDYPTYLATRLTALQSEAAVINQKLSVLQDISAVYVSLGVGAC